MASVTLSRLRIINAHVLNANSLTVQPCSAERTDV